MENFGKKFINMCLISTAAIGCMFVLYFVVMALLRAAWLCWTVLFDHSWTIIQ
jgi:hypothetical protein